MPSEAAPPPNPSAGGPAEFGADAFPISSGIDTTLICLPTLASLQPTGQADNFKPHQVLTFLLPIDGFLRPNKTFITLDVQIKGSLTLEKVGKRELSYLATADGIAAAEDDEPMDATRLLDEFKKLLRTADAQPVYWSAYRLAFDSLRPIIGPAQSVHVFERCCLRYGGDTPFAQENLAAGTFARNLALSDSDIDEAVGVCLDRTRPETFRNTMSPIIPAGGSWFHSEATGDTTKNQTKHDLATPADDDDTSTSNVRSFSVTIPLKIPLTHLYPLLAGMDPFPAVFCSDQLRFEATFGDIENYLWGLHYEDVLSRITTNAAIDGVSTAPSPAGFTLGKDTTTVPPRKELQAFYRDIWPATPLLLNAHHESIHSGAPLATMSRSERREFPIIGEYLVPIYGRSTFPKMRIGSPAESDGLPIEFSVKPTILDMTYTNVRLVCERFRPLNVAYAATFSRLFTMNSYLQIPYQSVHIVTTPANETGFPIVQNRPLDITFPFNLYNVDSIMFWLAPNSSALQQTLPLSLRRLQLMVGSSNFIPDRPTPAGMEEPLGVFYMRSLMEGTLGMGGGGADLAMRSEVRRFYDRYPRSIVEELRSQGLVGTSSLVPDLLAATTASLHRPTGRPRMMGGASNVLAFKLEVLDGTFATGISSDSISARMVVKADVAAPFVIPAGAIWVAVFFSDYFAKFTPNRFITTCPQGF